MHLFTHGKEERNRENVNKKIVNQNLKYIVVSYQFNMNQNDWKSQGLLKKTRWGLGSIRALALPVQHHCPSYGGNPHSLSRLGPCNLITNNCPKKQWKLCNLILSIVL